MHKIDVGVLGATGAVGRTFLAILEERQFPVGELRLLATPRSEGKKIPFRGEELTVHAVDERSFDGLDFVLSCANDNVSRELAPVAARSGAVVVDKSNAWRMAAVLDSPARLATSAASCSVSGSLMFRAMV